MSGISIIPSIEALGTRAGALAAEHIDHAFRAILRGDCVVAEPRFIRLITGAPHPFGNFVMLARADDPDAARSAVQPLVSCGAPAAVLTSGIPTAALAQELQSAGFEPQQGLPAMAIEIDRLPATPLPDECTFASVGPKDRQAWAEAFALGYELPQAVGEQFAAGIGASGIEYYAVMRGGTMVCTSAIFYHGGLAGIYAVATAPEARQQGLAAYATAEPLRRAKALGYRVGVLQSSAAGHSVYLKLGFASYAAEVALFVR